MAIHTTDISILPIFPFSSIIVASLTSCFTAMFSHILLVPEIFTLLFNFFLLQNHQTAMYSPISYRYQQ